MYQDRPVNMMLVEDTTTKAIKDPLNPLTINSILVRMVHFPLIQWERKALQK